MTWQLACALAGVVLSGSGAVVWWQASRSFAAAAKAHRDASATLKDAQDHYLRSAAVAAQAYEILAPLAPAHTIVGEGSTNDAGDVFLPGDGDINGHGRQVGWTD